jgi:RNA polymerase sigma-70 factor (ECF subfamily)
MPDASSAAGFEALFREHYAPLCSFVLRYVGTRAVAEELVQDVFAALWEKRSQLRLRSVKAYLFGAARNRALNHLAHQGVVVEWERRAALESGDGEADTAEDAHLRLEAEELSDALAAAVASLPERCRQTMVLRYQQRMSYAEIAEALGISAKGVENQLNRGLKALRERLRRD